MSRFKLFNNYYTDHYKPKFQFIIKSKLGRQNGSVLFDLFHNLFSMHPLVKLRGHLYKVNVLNQINNSPLAMEQLVALFHKTNRTTLSSKLVRLVSASSLKIEHLIKICKRFHVDITDDIWEWINHQLLNATPVWSSAYTHPIRKAWVHYLFENPDRKPEIDPEFASITICGIKLNETLPYIFNTCHPIAVWFSTKSTVALREKEQQCLIDRSDHPSTVTNTLIYSSALLNSQALKELKTFALEYSIILVDIDHSKLILSPLSAKLLQLVRLELQNLGHGGNPAAASDLVRWIPELMRGKVYADIDLPLNYRNIEKVHAIKKAGIPVVVNMGSIVTPPSQKSGTERCAINTDIIAYSDCNDTAVFMRKVAVQLIKIYEDPFTALIEAKAEICETAAFKQIQKRKGTLFDLRKAVEQCKTIADFYKFVGEILFGKIFHLSKDQVAECYFSIKYANMNPKFLFRNERDPQLIIKQVLQKYFKSLVEEISGPGAIYKALGGDALFTSGEYRPARMIPSIPIRALEGYACSNGMTDFMSDNIPPWRTLENDLNQMQFNSSGLSWVPESVKL
ncbi:glycosyltransferase family 88 protein [Legionella quateirensis]|uniref:Glucosyltransferase Lgt1 n=1 Tax=Legionella quateirensis TaxID=45072 RepID=A0A378KPT2_9GAMM|nr:glycosyltransferase family 88 protein [Legionella quateirensis]KTD52914.1 putative glucosyltransferase Lgt1 [Legionella quateirensis]STY16356.1 putative glucosyltransferase Lgt1 [Legionella quateirensis]